MSTRQKRFEELIAPLAVALDCRLWGIEFCVHGRQSLLRVYIDKDDGVTLDDCEKVSRQISSLMDVEDPINGQYTLEVSSPGMDRPLFTLEQCQQHVGSRVSIKLVRAFEGRKKYSGQLVAVENDELVIQIDDQQFILPFEWVEKAKVDPEF